MLRDHRTWGLNCSGRPKKQVRPTQANQHVPMLVEQTGYRMSAKRPRFELSCIRFANEDIGTIALEIQRSKNLLVLTLNVNGQ